MSVINYDQVRLNLEINKLKVKVRPAIIKNEPVRNTIN